MKSLLILVCGVVACSLRPGLACLPSGLPNPLDWLQCSDDEAVCSGPQMPNMYCGVPNRNAPNPVIVDYGNECRLNAAKCSARNTAGQDFVRLQCFVPSTLCGSACPSNFAEVCARNHSDTTNTILRFGNQCIFGAQRCLASNQGHYLYTVNCANGAFLAAN